MEETPLSIQPLSELTEARVRHGFIQKVYSLLCGQLLVTIAIGAGMMRLGQAWVVANPTLLTIVLFGSFVITTGVLCTMACYPQLTRKSPQNYLLLALFTFGQSLLVGFISLQYTQESVLVALGLTVLVVFGLTLFACQTTYDFTGLGVYLFAASLVLLGFGFTLSIASMLGAGGSAAFSTLRLVYAAGGALLFSFYLIYDTQKIVGGKHAYQYGIDDYVMATLTLYIDIVNLFLFLLQIFGKRRD